MNSDIVLFMQNIGVGPSFLPYLYWSLVALLVAAIIYLSDVLCRKVITPLVRKLTQKTQTEWDDVLLNDDVLSNFCALVPPILLTILLPLLYVADNALVVMLLRLCNVYLTIVAVKLVCSVFSSLYVISSEHEKLKNRALQGIFQMMKLVVICVGIIIVISELLDKDPVKVIAGFGASAAILMLVFKDTIMGLVAGVQLSVNDMLRPGDWITIPKFGADGAVTEVTLTTVKVQNWDKTITTIPPYLLVSDSFQNWRGMYDYGGRRVKRSVFIDMQSIHFCDEELVSRLTAEGMLKGIETAKGEPLVNLYVFRMYLENYLRNHPRVNSEMMIMVRQLQPTPQGLPLELYFFSDGTDWVPYENLQSEVFEHLFAVLPHFGLRVFQSPAGSDFSSFESDAIAVSSKKRPARVKKQQTDNSNTLFPDM